MTLLKPTLSRRTVLTGVSLFGLAACAVEHTASGDGAAAENVTVPKTPLEIANETVVNEFCEAWKYGETKKLTPFFADDIVYQVVENVPLINGKAEFHEKVQPFLDNFKTIWWETLRSSAMGRLVLNDRIDYYKDPIKGKEQVFKVTGIFRVENGKIKDWRDWSIPAGV